MSFSVKRRPSSDSTCYRRKKSHGRKNPSRQEKSEVPDIIEGVPVCSDEYRTCCSRSDETPEKKISNCRLDFQLHKDCDGKKER